MSRLVATAQSNVLRDNHYVLSPISGLYERSTLLETQRTNGWTFSEDLTNAAWSKSGATVTADAIQAPDGASTADKLVEDGTNAAHGFSRSPGTLTDNTQQALTFFARRGERTWIRVVTVDKGNTSRASWINLTTGAVGTKDSGHTVRVSRANNFFRIEVVWSSSSGATTPQVALHMATADGVSSYAGDGASGLYVWGLQIEIDQPFATSYIPTAGATATRSTDQLSFPLPAPLTTPQAMTAYLRFIERMSIDTTSGRYIHIGALAGAQLVFYVPAINQVRLRWSDGSTSSDLTITRPWSIGDHVELRLILNANGSVSYSYSINGATEVDAGSAGSTALAGSWSANTIWLASSVGTSPGCMALLRCRLAAGVQSLATMRGL